MAEFENILYFDNDKRAEIIFDRAGVLNALNKPMIEEINQALKTAYEDDDIYGIIISGRGRGFCSGGDIRGSTLSTESKPDRDSQEAELRELHRIIKRVYFGDKPVIAAINGPAVGAGCDIALACDLRIISEEAFLQEQYINIGLVPGSGGAWLLPRLVGESRANEYLLTGRQILPDEALYVGLVSEVINSDRVLERSREMAEKLQLKPSLAMKNTKKLVSEHQSFKEYTHDAIEFIWESFNDPEHQEAVTASIEERDPDFDR